jgi:hypothetical protein
MFACEAVDLDFLNTAPNRLGAAVALNLVLTPRGSQA